jgi:murein DD-endopeptidase MepM/ murein hydrolase activator NlpD
LNRLSIGGGETGSSAGKIGRTRMKRASLRPLKLLSLLMTLACSTGFLAAPAATSVPGQPDITGQAALTTTPNQSDQNETLKSFMASMTYTPKALPMPTEQEVQDLIKEMALTSPTSPEIEENVPVENTAPAPDKARKKTVKTASKNLNFLKPVVDAFVSSHFGVRWGKMHDGVDLAANAGAPIHAAEGGKITFSGWKGGYGNFVTIDHGSGYVTRYGHASALLVKKGQVVKRGQTIALVGSTGHSTGPHLHFEVVSKGKFQNPLAYINRTFTVALAR